MLYRVSYAQLTIPHFVFEDFRSFNGFRSNFAATYKFQ